MSNKEIIQKIETPAMQLQTVSIPVNPEGCDGEISVAQLAVALRLWSRGDKRIVPDFVETKIVEESGDEIVKEVLHYGKSSMADGSPNRQRTTHHGDNLMVTEYLGGPWFMAIAGYEERDDGEICFQLTTVRHKQHPDYVAPADAAAKAGASRPPPTVEKNARRVLAILRKLANNGDLK